MNNNILKNKLLTYDELNIEISEYRKVLNNDVFDFNSYTDILNKFSLDDPFEFIQIVPDISVKFTMPTLNHSRIIKNETEDIISIYGIKIPMLNERGYSVYFMITKITR
jgi:hypothetical protein